jgi:hypothetical protein
MTITVRVERVTVPPWSTIGYGFGRDEQGRGITFVGDQRPMRHLGATLELQPVEIILDAASIIDIDENVPDGTARSRTMQ